MIIFPPRLLGALFGAAIAAVLLPAAPAQTDLDTPATDSSEPAAPGLAPAVARATTGPVPVGEPAKTIE